VPDGNGLSPLTSPFSPIMLAKNRVLIGSVVAGFRLCCGRSPDRATHRGPQVSRIRNLSSSLGDLRSRQVRGRETRAQQRYAVFSERAGATSPVAKLQLPSIEKTVAAQRRGEARFAMLLAAIAVIEGGPERLADINARCTPICRRFAVFAAVFCGNASTDFGNLL